nr:MAG TPA: helix-turn-helix domain protein [Caudoviricetes sp.]
MRNVERAKQIAKSKGINFAFVCREIGKSRSYLSEMLASSRDLPEKMLEPVAQALGVPVSELTGEEQKEKPAPGEGSGLDALLKECEGLSKDELEEARRYIAYLKVKRDGI